MSPLCRVTPGSNPPPPPPPPPLQGDRAGVCVTQFDPTQLERGLVCTPQALVTIEALVASVHKIAYYKGQVGANLFQLYSHDFKLFFSFLICSKHFW